MRREDKKVQLWLSSDIFMKEISRVGDGATAATNAAQLHVNRVVNLLGARRRAMSPHQIKSIGHDSGSCALNILIFQFHQHRWSHASLPGNQLHFLLAGGAQIRTTTMRPLRTLAPKLRREERKKYSE